jgi:hypothetical protein
MYTGEMATPFTKLCSRTLRDQISEKIREAILAGSLAPGERLVERMPGRHIVGVAGMPVESVQARTFRSSC